VNLTGEQGGRFATLARAALAEVRPPQAISEADIGRLACSGDGELAQRQLVAGASDRVVSQLLRRAALQTAREQKP
jgi:hypothetical protein